MAREASAVRVRAPTGGRAGCRLALVRRGGVRWIQCVVCCVQIDISRAQIAGV